jgi:hypothetical protein
MSPVAKGMPSLPRVLATRLSSCTALMKFQKWFKLTCTKALLIHKFVRDDQKIYILIQAQSYTHGGARLQFKTPIAEDMPLLPRACPCYRGHWQPCWGVPLPWSKSRKIIGNWFTHTCTKALLTHKFVRDEHKNKKWFKHNPASKVVYNFSSWVQLPITCPRYQRHWQPCWGVPLPWLKSKKIIGSWLKLTCTKALLTHKFVRDEQKELKLIQVQPYIHSGAQLQFMGPIAENMPSLPRPLATMLRSSTTLIKIQKINRKLIQTYLHQGTAHSQVCERWIKRIKTDSSSTLHP